MKRHQGGPLPRQRRFATKVHRLMAETPRRRLQARERPEAQASFCSRPDKVADFQSGRLARYASPFYRRHGAWLLRRSGPKPSAPQRTGLTEAK
jgi:hypothetical protein